MWTEISKTATVLFHSGTSDALNDMLHFKNNISEVHGIVLGNTKWCPELDPELKTSLARVP